MSWNTKRDGYYSRPASNPLGSPVNKLEPHAGHTHAIIIPGTSYRCFLGEAHMKAPAPVAGKWDWDTHTQAPDIQRPAKVETLLKALARTTVASTGKRRSKVAPVLLTIEEFQALNTNSKAA